MAGRMKHLETIRADDLVDTLTRLTIQQRVAGFRLGGAVGAAVSLTAEELDDFTRKILGEVLVVARLGTEWL
jgi:hypothetical protein